MALDEMDNGVSLEDSPVGQDCVKKVEALYCDVCQRYLSRMEPTEKVLEVHCRTRAHHRAFEELQATSKIENLTEDNQHVIKL